MGNKEKTTGYQGDRIGFEREMKRLIRQLGHFPCDRELRALKRPDLIKGIQNHGKTAAVRKQMGHDEGAKPARYWESWNNLRIELDRAIKQLGHFPTQTELDETGYSNLNNAISRYHMGLTAVRVRMGYSQTRKPQGHWVQWRNVKKELTAIVEDLGHFPSYNELAERESGLITAIDQFHEGINAVRTKMGYALLQKPKGYWKVWENVEMEMRSIVAELGRFPTHPDIEKRGPISLSKLIIRYWGGIDAVRERMGYPAQATQEREQLEHLLTDYVAGDKKKPRKGQ